jgi:HK97 family phage prohead protease
MASDAPRDDLVRSAPFQLERAQGDDGLTLTGHGAVFNQWTTIDSWEGHFRERIAPGAFKKTLQENGSRVRLQFDHGQHPLIGSLPIGAIRKLKEDGKGLYVEARLADNWLVQPVREAIENESIDGMSFRFSVVAERWDEPDDKLPERTITEVRLMELGPVVWPAYEGTDIGVRSLELARSLMAADDNTRREIATILLRGEDPDPEAAEGTSDPDTHPSEAAQEGTSEERAVTDDEPAESHSRSDDPDGSSPYQPAQRPSLTLERIREDRKKSAARVAAASAKERTHERRTDAYAGRSPAA